MSTNQAQPPFTHSTHQPIGPIAQQLAKFQSNGQWSPLEQPPIAQQLLASQHIGTGLERKVLGKTLWEWLTILLVPLMIAAFTIAITLQQNQISQRQHDSDQKLAEAIHKNDLQTADDRQKEDILVNCQNDISDLLLNSRLGLSKEGEPVREVAYIKTLTALRRLDSSRKRTLIQFLYQARLIGGLPPHHDPFASSMDVAVISLESADLRGASLSEVHLTGIDLSGADLTGAILSKAHLLKAKLQNVDLSGSNLSDANLEFANLSDANLRGANLEDADLSYTNLSDADLRGANLRTVYVTPEQLTYAKSLRGATLPDGSMYPSQSYPLPNHIEPPGA